LKRQSKNLKLLLWRKTSYQITYNFVDHVRDRHTGKHPTAYPEVGVWAGPTTVCDDHGLTHPKIGCLPPLFNHMAINMSQKVAQFMSVQRSITIYTLMCISDDRIEYSIPYITERPRLSYWIHASCKFCAGMRGLNTV
jgi:hypothetical protein